jgi:hypothetical protein
MPKVRAAVDRATIINQGVFHRLSELVKGDLVSVNIEGFDPWVPEEGLLATVLRELRWEESHQTCTLKVWNHSENHVNFWRVQRTRGTVDFFMLVIVINDIKWTIPLNDLELTGVVG